MEISKLRVMAAEETAADAAPEKPPLLARMREKLPKKAEPKAGTSRACGR